MIGSSSPSLENKLPILPLRDIVVFPHMIVPLFVGRDKSVKAGTCHAGRQTDIAGDTKIFDR